MNLNIISWFQNPCLSYSFNNLRHYSAGAGNLDSAYSDFLSELGVAPDAMGPGWGSAG